MGGLSGECCAQRWRGPGARVLRQGQDLSWPLSFGMANQRKLVAIVGSRRFGRAALKLSPSVGFTLVFRLMMRVVVPSSSVHCTITCGPCSSPQGWVFVSA